MDTYNYNSLTETVIGAAIEVHRKIAPGLLESAYRECLTREFELRSIPFEREVAVPVVYKDIYLECGYRIDFLIARRLVLEIKSVEALAPGSRSSTPHLPQPWRMAHRSFDELQREDPKRRHTSQSF